MLQDRSMCELHTYERARDRDRSVLALLARSLLSLARIRLVLGLHIFCIYIHRIWMAMHKNGYSWKVWTEYDIRTRIVF